MKNVNKRGLDRACFASSITLATSNEVTHAGFTDVLLVTQLLLLGDVYVSGNLDQDGSLSFIDFSTLKANEFKVGLVGY